MTNRGMTLLEVLVAMVIVSIGVLTVLQSQAASHRLLVRTQANERIAILAEGVMERIVAQKKIPSTGKLTGTMAEPNDDVSWTAQIGRETWNDTNVMVRIDLAVKSRDAGLSLATLRYWP